MAFAAIKLGIKANARARLINTPITLKKSIQRKDLVISRKLTGAFDYIHVFVKKKSKLNADFPRLHAHLAPRGMLWVSWPKNGQLATDLTLTKIIQIGYRHGLVESKTISIDAIWSALKFTRPKQGKRYNNSYGKLPTQNRT